MLARTLFELFSRSGEIGYYLLYRQLFEQDDE